MFDHSLPPRDPKAWQAQSALHASRDAMAFVSWQAPAYDEALSPLSQQALAEFEAELDPQAGATSPVAERSPDPMLARFAAPKPPAAAGFQRTVYQPIQTRTTVPNALTSDPRGLTAASVEPAPSDDAARALALQDALEAPAPSATPEGGEVHDGLSDASHDAHHDAEHNAATDDPQAATSAQADVLDTEAADIDATQEPSAPADDAQTPQDGVSNEALSTEVTEAALTEEGMLEPQAMAEMERECEESLALQDKPVGIDPQEVARREAEQYQRGHEDGERAAREAMAQEIAAQRTVMEGVTQQLHALLKDPQAYFEPMKRLALHLAEHIVQGELRTSSHAVEQLIQRCLDALDHPAQGAVVVELHPQDKARLQEAAPELIQGMRLQTSPDLRPGSVRLFANDTQVQDLIEHRLQAIARNLALDTDAWQAHSVLLHDPADTTAPADDQAPPAQEDDDAHS